MKEIITSILQAEEFAKEIEKDALIEAQKIANERDAESEKTKATAVTTSALERKKKLIDAESDAKNQYEDIMAKAKEEIAEITTTAMEKVDQLSDRLAKEIINQWQ